MWVRVRSARLCHAVARERKVGRSVVSDTLCGWLALRPFESSENPAGEKCSRCVDLLQRRLPLLGDAGGGP
jgi:hypothetical protein